MSIKINLKSIQVFLFIVFVSIKVNGFPQTIEILWENTYGGNNDDRPQDVLETPDGGFLTVGYSNSIDGDVMGNHGLVDYWVTKANASGELEWGLTYGGSNYDHCFTACPGVTNGYL